MSEYDGFMQGLTIFLWLFAALSWAAVFVMTIAGINNSGQSSLAIAGRAAASCFGFCIGIAFWETGSVWWDACAKVIFLCASASLAACALCAFSEWRDAVAVRRGERAPTDGDGKRVDDLATRMRTRSHRRCSDG